MDPLLREFYQQDASFRSMPEVSQINHFNEWARERSLGVELQFRNTISWARLASGLGLALAFLASFWIQDLGHYRMVLLLAGILTVIARRRKPRVIRNQAGDS